MVAHINLHLVCLARVGLLSDRFVLEEEHAEFLSRQEGGWWEVTSQRPGACKQNHGHGPCVGRRRPGRGGLEGGQWEEKGTYVILSAVKIVKNNENKIRSSIIFPPRPCLSTRPRIKSQRKPIKLEHKPGRFLYNLRAGNDF